MTIAANFWPRPVPLLPRGVARSFETEPGTQVLGQCHWQRNPRKHPTLIVLHGLEGSCESGYMRGTGEKAWIAGFNVVRLNQRNCGGTEQLSPTLYHSGLSCDIHAVVMELAERDGLPVRRQAEQQYGAAAAGGGQRNRRCLDRAGCLHYQVVARACGLR